LIHQKKKQVIISNNNNNNKYFHHHVIYLNNKIHSDDDSSKNNYLNNDFKTRVKGSTSNKLLENARKLRQEVDDLEQQQQQQQQQKSKQLSDEQQSQQLNNNINYNTSNKYVDDVDDSRYNTLITNDNKIDELVSSTSSLSSSSSSSSSIKDDFQRSDFFANEKVQPKIIIKQPINNTVSTISSSGSEEDDTVNAFNPFKSLLTDNNNTASSPSSLLVDRKDLNKGKLLADKISTDSSKRLTDSKRGTSKISDSSSSSWGKSNTPNAYKLVEKSKSKMSDETKRIIENMSNSNSSNSYVYSDQSGDGSVNSKTLTKFLIENNMTFRDRLQMQFEKVKQAVVVVSVVADDDDDDDDDKNDDDDDKNDDDDDDDDVIDVNIVYDHNDYDLRCYIFKVLY
jgi:hypothetical protein